MKHIERLVFCLTPFFALISCAEISDFPIISQDDNRLMLIEPVQLWRASDGTCVEGERCWSALDQARVREELSLFESETAIHKVNSEGSLTFLDSLIGSEAGDYRVTQYAMAYTNLPCSTLNPNAGIRRVGAGVRVSAKIKTTKRNVNLGGFLPIAIAASNNSASGEIRINSWGMSSSNNAISTFLDVGGLALNEAGIQKAIESMAVARVLLNDEDTKITPWTLAIQETSIGSCTATNEAG